MIIDNLTLGQKQDAQTEMDNYAETLSKMYLDGIEIGQRDIAIGYIASIGFTLMQHRGYLTKKEIKRQMKFATLAARRFGDEACEFLRQEDQSYREGGEFECKEEDELRRTLDNLTVTNLSLENIAGKLLDSSHFWNGLQRTGYVPPADTRFRDSGKTTAALGVLGKLRLRDLAEGALYDEGFADELRAVMLAGRG